jgi:hypothetical protein
MKIDLGRGAYLEPDEGPRNTRWHMRIERSERIPNTRSGNWLYLACGHRSMAFGNLGYAGGVVLCTQCRDQEEQCAPKP